MVTSSQIKVHIDNSYIEHYMLDYIDNLKSGEENRKQIQQRLNAGTSIVCEFFIKENAPLFVAVIDFEDTCIHVREVGGHFGRYYKYLDTFVQSLAKYLNKSEVSFNTDRRSVVLWAIRSGYSTLNNKEYFKKVS